MLKYVLAANVFMTAARDYYSFDFGNTFWNFLLENAKKGVLCSIDKVLEDIERGNDKLKEWAKNEFKNFFYATNNNEVLSHCKEIVNHVQKNQNYLDKAIVDFLREDNSDAFVIAFAKSMNIIVVTNESYNPQAKRKVLIPVVCKDFRIETINIFGMLKNLNFKC